MAPKEVIGIYCSGLQFPIIMMKPAIVFLPLILTVSCGTKPAAAPTPEIAATAAIGSIVRLDPALDALVPRDAQIEKLAGGFTFIEGPLWRPEGALWFSDVVGNVVRQWTPDGKSIVVLRSSPRRRIATVDISTLLAAPR